MLVSLFAATKSGDKILAQHCINAKSAKPFNGIILDLKVASSKIVVSAKFWPEFRATFNEGFGSFTVEFEPNRLRFVRMHKANDIVKATYSKEALFPTTFEVNARPQLNVKLDDGDLMGEDDFIISWYNTALNAIQKQAVVAVLRADCTNFSYVINGPPGKCARSCVLALESSENPFFSVFSPNRHRQNNDGRRNSAAIAGQSAEKPHSHRDPVEQCGRCDLEAVGGQWIHCGHRFDSHHFVQPCAPLERRRRPEAVLRDDCKRPRRRHGAGQVAQLLDAGPDRVPGGGHHHIDGGQLLGVVLHDALFHARAGRRGRPMLRDGGGHSDGVDWAKGKTRSGE